MKLELSLVKKRQQRKKAERERQSGICFLEDKISLDKEKSIASCLLKGILIFLGTYGVMGGYLSCFSIAYQKPFVVFLLGTISLYLALICYDRRVKNIGYILLFLLYFSTAWKYRHYIDSGFSAIMNQTYDIIDQKYILPSVQHFSEKIADRYVTATFCIIFLGIFEAILLNIAISGYMSFFATLSFTFPVIFVGLYFDKMPNPIFMIMLLLCWICVGFFKNSPRYEEGNSKKVFRYQYKKGIQKYQYRIQGKAFVQAGSMIMGIILVLFMAVNVCCPKSSFQTPKKWNFLKEETDEYVRKFMMEGFSSFINRYHSAGGISGGKLGGISSVRPNYETDLVVQFVPYDYETIYLKAFTGYIYGGDAWIPYPINIEAYEKMLEKETWLHLKNRESNLLKDNFEKNKEAGFIKSKMRIQNKGANTSYLYLPYYAQLEDNERIIEKSWDTMLAHFEQEDSYEVEYYPFANIKENAKAKNRELDQEYLTYVKENYLFVSSKNKSVIRRILRKIDLQGTQENKIEAVLNYLHSQCVYSMRPGLTPKEADFVNYFLLKNKKGFCVHFASTATLMFRTLGIPARYVEGYAIDYNKVADSDILENEAYEDWFAGKAPIGKTAVVETEVTDGQAHAWVEIYKEGFGWVPIEVTPANYEEEYTDFWSNFSNLFSISNGNGEDGTVNDFNLFQGSTAFLNSRTGKIIFIFLGIGMGYIGAFKIGIFVRRKLKRKALFNGENQNENVRNRYEYICYILKRGGYIEESIKTRERFIQVVTASVLEEKDSTEHISLLIERAVYSPYALTQEEYESVVLYLKNIIENYKKQQNIIGKVKLFFF